MKSLKVILLLLVLIPLTVFSQTNSYRDGWEAGYKAGYCYQDYGCVSPVAPVSPVPRVGKNTYQDGYNRGFTKGKSENNGSKNSGGAYGQLKPLKNSNTGSIVQEHIRQNKQSTNKRRLQKQNSKYLTLDKILSFQKKSLASVEEYLTVNNWELEGGDENKISFIKGKNINTNMLTFFYDERKNVTSLVVMFFLKTQYSSYNKQIKKLRCKLTSTKIGDNEILKIYKNKRKEFHVTVAKKGEKTNVSLYSIFIK